MGSFSAGHYNPNHHQQQSSKTFPYPCSSALSMHGRSADLTSTRTRLLALNLNSAASPALLPVCLAILLSLQPVLAIHHMRRDPLPWVNRRDSDVPLTITNYCTDPVWPAVQTQAGVGPNSSGFVLASGASCAQSVSANWQGRVWARTNCSFNAQGTAAANGAPGPACTTGDCGGTLECRGAGQTPASLAEFTLETNSGQTFYDLSLVDGYNIPIGIISLLGTSDNSTLTDIPPNLTNPVCIGTAALLTRLATANDSTFGSNATYPLPLDQSVTQSYVQGWCPWDLQLSPPQKPGDGVYPYPDDNIQRPAFNPCISACAKYNDPSDCCTGSHDSPNSCSPSLYSTRAKVVCPDAYSYAFDDQDSTFIVPSGGGFEVVFCPQGRSTTILKTLGNELRAMAQAGYATPQIRSAASNATYIQMMNGGVAGAGGDGQKQSIFAAVLLVIVVAWLF